MRWRNDLALGSPLSLGIGLRIVYGWQDGERSQRSAAYAVRSSAAKVHISTCIVFSSHFIRAGGGVCGPVSRQSLGSYENTLCRRADPNRRLQGHEHQWSSFRGHSEDRLQV